MSITATATILILRLIHFYRTLFPVFLLYRANIIDRVRKEKWSLKVGQFCSRWLMRVFPFASKRVLVDADDERLKNPKPSIWVCNHISMLDLFFVLVSNLISLCQEIQYNAFFDSNSISICVSSYVTKRLWTKG